MLIDPILETVEVLLSSNDLVSYLCVFFLLLSFLLFSYSLIIGSVMFWRSISMLIKGN